MVEKYMIHLPQQGIVALKFDMIKREMVIGGNARFRRIIDNIIQDYFQLPATELQWTQRNKIRYVMFCTKRKFDEALDLLREHSITVEAVTSLGRLMR